VYNENDREFEFAEEPIFANVVLADEINRAPPKTQAALLEAMEEGQVSVDGTTHALPLPFVVIATQNTIDRARTYELPMAELDRFMKRIRLGYPDHDEEVEVLSRVVDRHPIEGLSPVADGEEIVRGRRTVAGVTVREPLRSYATRLSAYTRERAPLGVSPRGTIALVRAAQARAVLDGRGYVIPDDVQAEVRAVFPHRIAAGELEVDDLVAGALEAVPVP
jgi:MoxR-like ATPase